MNYLVRTARGGGKSRLYGQIRQLYNFYKTGKKDGNKLGKRKRLLYLSLLKRFGIGESEKWQQEYLLKWYFEENEGENKR